MHSRCIQQKVYKVLPVFSLQSSCSLNEEACSFPAYCREGFLLSVGGGSGLYAEVWNTLDLDLKLYNQQSPCPCGLESSDSTGGMLDLGFHNPVKLNTWKCLHIHGYNFFSSIAVVHHWWYRTKF